MAKKTKTKTKAASKKAAPSKTKRVKKAATKTTKASTKRTKSSPKAASKKTASVKKAVKKNVATKTSKKSTSKLANRTKTGRKVEILVAKAKKAKKMVSYSKKDLAEFKAVILGKRTEIIDQLQNLKEQMMDESTGQYVNENSPYSLHMAEQGTDAQEREKLYLWAQRETKFLGYLEDALQRIENGTYGVCIDSLDLPEGPHLIPKNRLLAVPHTQHCVACKNKKK